MKQNRLPIPAGWRLFFRDIQRRVQTSLTSPATKLGFLVFLIILFSRDEFSFSITVGGSTSVFKHTRGGTDSDPAMMATLPSLASYAAPEREWTAKQLAQLDYVKQYQHIALQEMRASGIPASITLAQGLLESGTGKSTLATRNNNHFGIKCFSKQCSKGHCSNHSDDHHKDFFRNFENVEESYAAHSRLLKKQRYRSLFSLDGTDYRGWARGLSKAGYATDPRYADKLIRMIEDLGLHHLDRVTQRAR